MKRLFRNLVLSITFIACIAAVAIAQDSPVTITLLHVNDTHSHLDATGPKDWHLDGTTGGLAKAATIIQRVRQREPNVLLLHAGDAFHGDFFFNAYFGVPEFLFMKQLGFDAMAVGNHEFDLGPGMLAHSLAQAFAGGSFPLLSANLDLSAYDTAAPPDLRLSPWVKPSVIKQIGGLSIGIFGMTVPGVPTTRSDPVRILGSDPAQLMGIAFFRVQGLRAAGAQVVICLSHLGYLYDQAMAENVPGIDIIVGGHDHYEFAQPVTFTNQGTQGATLYVQAGKHYEHVGKMHFTAYKGTVQLRDYALIDVDRKIDPLPQIQTVVDNQLKPGIVQLYGDVYHKLLALVLDDITMTNDPNRRERDSGMGNLITDAMRARTHTEIALTANGLISEGITRGLIVGADIFRPVSFGYDVPTGLGLKLATFEISAIDLIKGLEIGLAYLGIDEDYFVQVSGMRFHYDSTQPPFQRIVPGSLFINGKAWNPAGTYTVTANTGLVALLPLMGISPRDVNYLPDIEYLVLRDYIHRLGILYYPAMGRIEDLSIHR